MDTKKEGFSYTSPDVERKSALKLLTFEGVILLIVIIGIVLLLFYLKIITVAGLKSMLLPNKSAAPDTSATSMKPNKPVGSNTRSSVPSSQIVVPTVANEPDIEAVSDNSVYRLMISDKIGIEDIVKNWKVSSYLAAQNSNQPLQKIIIHLTDREQTGNKYLDQDKKVYLAASYKTTNNVADILIYLGSSAFTTKSIDPNGAFATELLTTLYYLTHPMTSKDQLPALEKSMNIELKNFIAKHPNTFTITKK